MLMGSKTKNISHFQKIFISDHEKGALTEFCYMLEILLDI